MPSSNLNDPFSMRTPPSRSSAEFEDYVARDEEVGDKEIHFSRLSGMAPGDIDVLSDFSFEHALLIVIRCLKRPARYHHGRYRPKTSATSELGLKSDPRT